MSRQARVRQRLAVGWVVPDCARAGADIPSVRLAAIRMLAAACLILPLLIEPGHLMDECACLGWTEV